MRWTERQRAMLGAMGVTLWRAPGDGAEAQPAPPRAAPASAAQASAAAALLRVPTSTPVSAARPAAPAVSTHVAPVADRDARARTIATLDWTALRESVAACRACRLCEGRTQTVFGVGHAQAHWMIVGEAPGEQEDRLGEPFVGAAGQLLDRMLAALALTRAEAPAERQVYIANTLKCRPPRNRNPEADELALCSEFLRRQIELVQPRIILAMGRFAVQSLLGSGEPIGRLRGRVHRYRDTPVIVTYHPAYLLRTPADKARSWADLCLAAAQLAR